MRKTTQKPVGGAPYSRTASWFQRQVISAASNPLNAKTLRTRSNRFILPGV